MSDGWCVNGVCVHVSILIVRCTGTLVTAAVYFVDADKSQKFCIWLTGQPCSKYPQDMLQYLFKVSYSKYLYDINS